MSSPTATTKQLHWTQRVALIRHNLHVASRSGDFGFFRTLQAAGFMEGTNHVATLIAELGDDADIVLAAMDNLNAGLAYVHQDAFKNVYESLKATMPSDEETDKQDSKSNLYVAITMQKNMADMAIDKMASSAVGLIHQQPLHAQESAANVWMTGATIIADSMAFSLAQMDALETKRDDFIRMEDSWNAVKASVVCAVTGLKGVFRLMDTSSSTPQESNSQRPSPRSSETFMNGLRRLSNAFIAAPSNSRSNSLASFSFAPGQTMASASSTTAQPSDSRNNSTASAAGVPVYRTPNYLRNSISSGCPTSLPARRGSAHQLSPIPPTPAPAEEELDPFDTGVPLPPMPSLPVHAESIYQRRRSLAAM